MKLNDRYNKLFTSSRCIRCNARNEDWQHIWICEKNDTSLRELAEDAAIKIWKIEGKNRVGKNDKRKDY